jgi:membrane-bound metal-dependent hydrolase YbcI (DUF457 family)
LDPITHGLASYALKRSFFPRAPVLTTVVILISGVAADLDWLSFLFGPSTFLAWHRTYTHSLFGSIFLATLIAALPLVVILVMLMAKRSAGISADIGEGGYTTEQKRVPILRAHYEMLIVLFLSSICSALLHLAMDACQSEGVTLLWPFRRSRFALDWLPEFDFWILAILLGAILVPELFLLVSSEIGARTKRPHGRNGAIAGFVLLLLYAGARESLHASAVGTLRATAYAGESPHRVAAFPDSASLFTWHGVVETQSALHLLDVSALPGAYFSPDSGVTVHKPEDSRVLEAAQKTLAAREFLAVARFPKATIERETTGYSVEIRDLRYAALRQTAGAVEVNVNLDGSGNVTFQSLEWETPQRKR